MNRTKLYIALAAFAAFAGAAQLVYAETPFDKAKAFLADAEKTLAEANTAADKTFDEEKTAAEKALKDAEKVLAEANDAAEKSRQETIAEAEKKLADTIAESDKAVAAAQNALNQAGEAKAAAEKALAEAKNKAANEKAAAERNAGSAKDAAKRNFDAAKLQAENNFRTADQMFKNAIASAERKQRTSKDQALRTRNDSVRTSLNNVFGETRNAAIAKANAKEFEEAFELCKSTVDILSLENCGGGTNAFMNVIVFHDRDKVNADWRAKAVDYACRRAGGAARANGLQEVIRLREKYNLATNEEIAALKKERDAVEDTGALIKIGFYAYDNNLEAVEKLTIENADALAADLAKVKPLESKTVEYVAEVKKITAKYGTSSVDEFYRIIISKLTEKKVFGCELADKFFARRIAAATAPALKASLMREYAQFRHSYCLATLDEAMKLFADSFNVPGLTNRELADAWRNELARRCRKNGGFDWRYVSTDDAKDALKKAVDYAAKLPQEEQWGIRKAIYITAIQSEIDREFVEKTAFNDAGYADARDYSKALREYSIHFNGKGDYAATEKFLNDQLKRADFTDDHRIAIYEALASFYKNEAKRYLNDSNPVMLKKVQEMYQKSLDTRLAKAAADKAASLEKEIASINAYFEGPIKKATDEKQIEQFKNDCAKNIAEAKVVMPIIADYNAFDSLYTGYQTLVSAAFAAKDYATVRKYCAILSTPPAELPEIENAGLRQRASGARNNANHHFNQKYAVQSEYYLGVLAFREENYEEAIKLIEPITKRQHFNHELRNAALNAYVRSFIALGREAEAAELVDMIIKENPWWSRTEAMAKDLKERTAEKK